MPARILGPGDAEVVRSLLARDPVANVFVSSRVDVGLLWPGSSAALWGWPAERPRQLVHAGANLVPVIDAALGDDPAEAIAAFVEVVGSRRMSQAIVGDSAVVGPLHAALSRRYPGSWNREREIRAHQPVMVARSVTSLPAAPVRPIAMGDFESYVAAAISMYTEEVGVDPTAGGGRSGYRAHCRSLIETGRAYGIVTDGHVVFKADIGAASGDVAQVQGVWLAPHLRGRHLAAPAMAAATRAILERYPVVSLYVNDFNTRAIRTYERCGYSQAGTFATVLY